MINSLLDTDAYKLTMANAILRNYPNATAEFQFINRRKTDTFDEDFKKRLDAAIEQMRYLSLTDKEHAFLVTKMPYLSREFIEFLRNYRFNPDEVTTKICREQLLLSIKGPYYRTTFWEVPLMATISEIYFGTWRKHDEQWDCASLEEQTTRKAETLSGKCNWADFGTRRRRSSHTQDIVVKLMSKHRGFVGTSNVSRAMNNGVKAIGTFAHEWVQAHSVLKGMRHANRFALDAWADTFRGALGIALSDTYGTSAFFDDFDLYLAKLFDGVRHDSGDPFVFASKTISHYRSLGISPATKTIVFSDNLNPDKCIELRKYCGDTIPCSFGIGTNLTNDFPASKALNMVIKLVRLNDIPVVKLSDDPAKETGDSDALRIARWTFFKTPLDA